MFAFLPLQRAVGNVEGVKDIEERVHSLSSVLSAPVSEDDHAEKARRLELQRSALAQSRSSPLTLSQKTREGSREA